MNKNAKNSSALLDHQTNQIRASLQSQRAILAKIHESITRFVKADPSSESALKQNLKSSGVTLSERHLDALFRGDIDLIVQEKFDALVASMIEDDEGGAFPA